MRLYTQSDMSILENILGRDRGRETKVECWFYAVKHIPSYTAFKNLMEVSY